MDNGGGAPMSGPAILIDVDGPLNPYAEKAWRRPAGYTTHRLRPEGTSWVKPLRVWLNPEHGPQLIELATTVGAELAWATSWEDEANRLIGPIVGLPNLEVISFAGAPRRMSLHGAGYVHDKVPAVAAWAGDRPICWLDDEVQRSDLEWAQQRTMDGSPTLLVQVSPRSGIQAAHLTSIRDFLPARR